MRRPPPVALGALAGFALLVGHHLGYAAAGDPSRGHQHLAALGLLFAVAASAVGWVAAVRTVRRSPWAPPELRSLLALQVAGHVLLETAERWIGSADGAVASAPVLLGLAAQPVVALVTVRLLHAGLAVTDRIETAPISPTPAGPGRALVPMPRGRSASLPGPVPAGRGPPVVVR